MAKHKKRPVIPIYAIAVVWIIFTLVHPLYRVSDYVTVILLSAVVFIVAKGIFPTVEYELPDPPKEEPEAPPKEEPAPEAEAAKEEAPEEPASTGYPKIDALVLERDRAIQEMRRLNDAIEDEEISRRIDQLEDATGKIIDQVIAHPEKLPQIRKFMNYYLPTTLKAGYAKASANVDKIVENLEAHQITLMKDVANLDQMFELNAKYQQELTMYILAGKKRLAQIQAEDLAQLQQQAQASGTQADAQAYNDMVSLCNRFEKKLHDLELTRMISLQMGPQTRMLQNNDTLMIEKIQSSLVNTIPLWKSQMVLALGLEHARQATAAQNAVTEMTNNLLRQNADLLKSGTIETAREAERSIVDLETLRHTNQQLMDSLDEVLRIQTEGAQKRREAEAELGRIEGELKQKLLALRT